MGFLTQVTTEGVGIRIGKGDNYVFACLTPVNSLPFVVRPDLNRTADTYKYLYRVTMYFGLKFISLKIGLHFFFINSHFSALETRVPVRRTILQRTKVQQYGLISEQILKPM